MPEEKCFTFVAGGRVRSKFTRMVFMKQVLKRKETTRMVFIKPSFEEEGESKQNQTEVILLYQPKCCTASP